MIFRDNAPKYWAAGLPVIPLRGKIPVITAWQNLSARQPTADETNEWLVRNAMGNMGLVLGQAAGLVAVDVDTTDPVELGVIEKVLPYSPWVRRGKKGFVRLYKYTGQQPFRVKRGANQTKPGQSDSIIDFLSTGQQVVLPPSIHPDTNQPYTANCDLLDVIDQLGVLPPNIEDLLRDALKQVGVETQARGKASAASDYVPAGSRDTELVRQAGRYSYDILKGTLTLKEACDRGYFWVEDQVQKVFGDDVGPEKMVEKIVECLKKDIYGPRKRTLPPGWDEGLDKAAKEKLGVAEFGDDERRFAFEEIRDFFKERVESGTVIADSPMMMDLIEVVCQRVARNPEINQMHLDQLIRFMVSVSGKTVSGAAIKKRILELSRGEIAGTDHSELARAVLEQISREGELRYYNDRIWQWYGAYWRPFEDSEVLKLISTEYGGYPAAKRQSDHTGILKTLKNLIGGPLQKNSLSGINFVNGFLTEDLELRPHDKDYGAIYCLPYPYRPELAGKATLFMNMLANYWGDDEDFAEKLDALQQAMAATMFGVSTRYQRAFCLLGVAASGKSRVLEIIKGLMPDGCASALPPHTWSRPFDLAEIAGRIMNVAGELSESAMIDGSTFKDVIVGAEMPAQRKYGQPFKFRPVAAHWFASNHAPNTKDASEGFTRRWLLFTFHKPFKGERIPDYEQIVLSQEREAIAAWAVQGLQALKAQGSEYTIPRSHVYAIEQVADRVNSVRFFLKTLRDQGRLLVGLHSHAGKSNTSISHDPLYSEYRNFCVTVAAVSPVNSQQFASRMEELKDPFDFQVRRVARINGATQLEYQYVTLALARAA